MRKVVHYHGQVQGVGFRATARHVASTFSVTGWVRNESDGSVRLEIQGSAHDIAAVLAEIDHRLAPFIRTRDLHEMAEQASETGFVIRH